MILQRLTDRPTSAMGSQVVSAAQGLNPKP